jgi:hypothetical protein
MLTCSAIGQGLLDQSAEWTVQNIPNPSLEYSNGNGNSGIQPGAIDGMTNRELHSKHSPLGMEMGEFMLDGDLEFLNSQMIEYNQWPGV